MVNSLNALTVQLLLMTLTSIVVASLVYFAEQGTWDPERQVWLGPDGEPTAFVSIPVCVWWAWVTMTTVGYGDMSPQTLGGRLIAMVTMVLGVLSIAMPVTVVANNFHEQYMLKKVRAAAERRRRPTHHATKPTMLQGPPCCKAHHAARPTMLQGPS